MKDDDLYCYNFDRAAPWRSTTTTMSQFWEEVHAEGRRPSPIWQIPGFLTQYCVPDLMHVSCLGIVQYLSGNVMWELLTSMGGEHPQPRHNLRAAS